MEIWKPINGDYDVSNQGNIRSWLWARGRRKEPVLMKLQKHKEGYLTVKLKGLGHQLVHRLVASAFLDNPKNLPFVNHINEIRNCNLVDNLEWCTEEHNSIHSMGKEYRVELPCGSVEVITGLRKFCREHGLDVSCLHATLTGKQTQHKGYKLWQS